MFNRSIFPKTIIVCLETEFQIIPRLLFQPKWIVNLLSSGDGLKDCLFELFSKVWAVESKPEQWKETVIIQLYKGIGDPSSYNCQRNIHTKADSPKFFECIVVDRSKEKIVRKCSKFQIGGIPGHRPQEHLFTAKSIIALYNYLNIPLFLQRTCPVCFARTEYVITQRLRQ